MKPFAINPRTDQIETPKFSAAILMFMKSLHGVGGADTSGTVQDGGDIHFCFRRGNFRKSKSHNGGRRRDSSSAISKKSGFVAATSKGTSCSFSASPTTSIPACPESVASTSSRNSRGRLATTTRTLDSMHPSGPTTLEGNEKGEQAGNGTGVVVLWKTRFSTQEIWDLVRLVRCWYRSLT